ncbi:ABC transporter G family member 12 [Cyphellophora attinorum]|uniref:ABC transporter G family member 12 n=1 Tax=Cyphellophora attinorum TaxID=1664694 RepID=A0A0N1P3I3_9EURO|nr:ABC transporter G family member 12 [Phialophora attinorum]KPI44025.1 ABC transporter G family member 12 [Phialophora attinorum]
MVSPSPDKANGYDVEAQAGLARYLTNNTVQSFSWRNLNVTVKDHKNKQPLSILTSSYGLVAAGQVLALMGPSGSGKTTLLNALAHRVAASNAQVAGDIMMDGQRANRTMLRQASSYVEQEDALIGSLTVRETVDFAARLSLGQTISSAERHNRVDSLIAAFGLNQQANTIVGTPLQKGISGGQKRRLGVASQLVTSPSILFLDEPTSGLDSAASREVMSYISDVAKQHHIIVIASIHQPSSSTFALFDQFLLLSAGKTCFQGPTSETQAYFERIGRPIPGHYNPAEYLLDHVNTDFAKDRARADQQLQQVHDAWESSDENQRLIERTTVQSPPEKSVTSSSKTASSSRAALILLHRNWIKAYRDLLTYGTRIAMYLGLAILMGTVWLRLPYEQTSIQPFINAIFFGGAFMSFMAVAYVPPMIEDLQTFRKERANGLYGPLSFTIANFLIGLPFLFLIALLFSVVTYWLSNFRSSAGGFFWYLLWLFLDLLAAEGLVVLVTSVAPIFVVALAVTAFANGLWMSVGGFLVDLGSLNVFWKYVFHYIDYQAYVFQGMMVNQFRDTTYTCARVDGKAQCMYLSDLAAKGKIRGTAVLDAYHYAHDDKHIGKWVGILISIIVVYRLLGYLVLRIQKS